MNAAQTHLSYLSPQEYIAVYCGNHRCPKHSMGTFLDIPKTIREYGDLHLMDLGRRFRCKDCGHKPAEVRHGWGLPEGSARGWVVPGKRA